MKKISFFILLSVCAYRANAQQGSVSTGGDATGAGGSASFSIGQISYLAAGDASYSVSEGVQQPYEISVLTSVNEAGNDIRFNVYPNPTVTGVNITVSENTEALSVQLFDAAGKMLAQQNILSSTTNVSMDQLPAGSYLLTVTGKGKTSRTFRIIKNK
jgi:hypothetical protein